MHAGGAAPGAPGSGLGLNLPGNAVRALAALGLAEEVVDRGMRIRRREYRNQAGRLLFSVDEEAFWGEVGPSVCLRRGDLLEVLRASTPEVAPRWDTPLAGAELVDQGVRVQLASGPAEIYDFVVGADGVHSSVRRAVIPEADPRQSLMTEASWRFTVKANQPTLLDRCARLAWHNVPVLDRDRGHGRVERRTLKAVSVAKFGFPHAAQVLQVTRKRRDLRTRRWRTVTVYAITSLPHAQASPAYLADLLRGHWAIENGLHHVRDTTFAEDASQLRTGAGPHVMACLRNLAIGALCRAGPVNLAAALRHHARDPPAHSPPSGSAWMNRASRENVGALGSGVMELRSWEYAAPRARIGARHPRRLVRGGSGRSRATGAGRPVRPASARPHWSTSSPSGIGKLPGSCRAPATH